MSSFSKIRVYLDRSEVWLVLLLFALTAGLMFTLGVLVGHGLNAGAPGGAAGHLSESTHHALGEHAEAGHGHARSPASVEEEGHKPGKTLRKAFRESKQEALVELALREESLVDKPTSVLDAEAHMKAHSEWDRKPAAEEISDEAKEKIETARKKEEDREKAGIPTAVKGLFERKISSLEEFRPKSGDYTIQVASFATPDEAQSKVLGLKKSKFHEAYMEPIRVKGETWYRVCVGSFSSHAWAEKIKKTLERRGMADQAAIRQVP